MERIPPLPGKPLPIFMQEAHRSVYELTQIGLTDTVKFLTDLLINSSRAPQVYPDPSPRIPYIPSPAFLQAKAFFDDHDFEQCVDTLKKNVEISSHGSFLYYYSTYLKILTNMRRAVFEEPEKIPPPVTTEMRNDVFLPLKAIFRKYYVLDENTYRGVSFMNPMNFDGEPSPFLYYIFGVILRRMGKLSKAIVILVRSVVVYPTLWCSWVEIAEICASEHLNKPVLSERMKKMLLEKADPFMPYRLFNGMVGEAEKSAKKKNLMMMEEEDEEEEEEEDVIIEEEEPVENRIDHENMAKASRADLNQVFHYLYGEETDDFPVQLKHLDEFVLSRFFNPNRCSPTHYLMYLLFMHYATFRVGGSQENRYVRPHPMNPNQKFLIAISLYHQKFIETHKKLMYYFPNCPSLMTTYARFLYTTGRQNEAQDCLIELNKRNPHRMEAMDLLAHLLFVGKDGAGLSRLAHALYDQKKFSKESCLAVGDYYTFRKRNEHAIFYYQRAIQLDSKCVSAWVLMGHCYVNMRNTTAAVHCYRQGVRTSPGDWRPWYGLGRVYQRSGAMQYAVYYLSKAVSFRRHDAHLWFSMASTYLSLDRWKDACRCYERVVGFRGMERYDAMNKLARTLWTKLGDFGGACYSYEEFTTQFEKDSRIFDEEISVERLKNLERRTTNRFVNLEAKLSEDETNIRDGGDDDKYKKQKPKKEGEFPKQHGSILGDEHDDLDDIHRRRSGGNGGGGGGRRRMEDDSSETIGSLLKDVRDGYQKKKRRENGLDDDDDDDDDDLDDDDDNPFSMQVNIPNNQDENDSKNKNNNNAKKNQSEEEKKLREEFLFYNAKDLPFEMKFMIRKEKSTLDQFGEALLFLFRYYGIVQVNPEKMDLYGEKLVKIKNVGFISEVLRTEINKVLTERLI